MKAPSLKFKVNGTRILFQLRTESLREYNHRGSHIRPEKKIKEKT
jgi:hypothetical protein